MIGLFGLAAIAFPADRAHATDLKVYSPIVEQGEFAVEARGNIAIDDAADTDGELNQRFEIEYTPTHFWHTAVVGEVERAPGGSLEYDATSWENIIQIFPQGREWLDLGVYVEYEFAGEGGEPDALEWKILAEKNVGPVTVTINPIFEKELGDNSEGTVEFGYAARVKWRLMRELEPAIEAYGELGELDNLEPFSEQRHQIGPVLLGRLGLGPRTALRYEAGYLFGLSGDGSPAGAFKWLAELEFHF